MWWPVAVFGALAAIVAIALAVLIPARRSRRAGLALANTTRLTRLPEYRAVLAAQTRSAAMVLAALLLLFSATVLASARPTATTTGFDQDREDVMLCVAEPGDAEATGPFLRYFARQAAGYGTTRIGLTSSNRRAVPLTRDYQFTAERFGDYAQGTRPLRAPVDYSDYAPTLPDVLALCLNGFPGFPAPGDTNRAVIYLGPGELRAPGDDRPSLFTQAQVTDMARRAGVLTVVPRNALEATPPGLSALNLPALAMPAVQLGLFMLVENEQLRAVQVLRDALRAAARSIGDIIST